MKRKELSLEIKVYSYSCKEEKEEHVIEMRQSGFNIKKEDYKHDCEYKYIVKYEKDTSNTNEYCLNLEPDFEDCGNYFTDEEKKEKLNTIITGIQDTILNEMKTEFHFVISAKNTRYI